MCVAEARKSPAMMAPTSRSGRAVLLRHTARTAIITATLPMAQMREQSQTERTLAGDHLDQEHGCIDGDQCP